MTPEERKKSVKKAYQTRMQTEDSPKAEAWRANRRRLEKLRVRDRSKRNEQQRTDPELQTRRREQRRERDRIRAITAKVRAHNEAEERSRVAESAKKRMVDALASLPVAKVERQSVEEWLAAGNQVEVLPSNLGTAYAGLNSQRITFY